MHKYPHVKGSVAWQPSRYGFAHGTLPTREAATVFTASAVALYKDAMDDVNVAETQKNWKNWNEV
jgi:hypothetical protein